MAGWPTTTVWRQMYIHLVTVFGLLITPTAIVTAEETLTSEVGPQRAGQRIAAYHKPHGSPNAPLFQTQAFTREQKIGGRITEAKRILMELQAFIEETARAVKLDNHLKIRRIENARLKEMLLSSRTAMEAIEDQANPIEDTLSTLTGTVVRNWLRSVQLAYRSGEAERQLIEVQKSWSDVGGRVATLRQMLKTRRTELQSLRVESLALGDEISQMRRQVTETKADISLFEKERADIAAAVETLRRNVTSKLRKTLLESLR